MRFEDLVARERDRLEEEERKRDEEATYIEKERKKKHATKRVQVEKDKVLKQRLTRQPHQSVASKQ